MGPPHTGQPNPFEVKLEASDPVQTLRSDFDRLMRYGTARRESPIRVQIVSIRRLHSCRSDKPPTEVKAAFRAARTSKLDSPDRKNQPHMCDLDEHLADIQRRRSCGYEPRDTSRSGDLRNSNSGHRRRNRSVDARTVSQDLHIPVDSEFDI